MNNNENHAASKSQTDRILDHLLSGKSITPLEALNKLNDIKKIVSGK